MIMGVIIRTQSKSWFLFQAFLFNWPDFSRGFTFVVLIYCLDEKSFNHFAYWVWSRNLFYDIDFQAWKVWHPTDLIINWAFSMSIKPSVWITSSHRIEFTLREAIEFLKFPLFFWRTKLVNQKWKRGFPMMGRLYLFSHDKTKWLRMFLEKVNQSKKILRKGQSTAI